MPSTRPWSRAFGRWREQGSRAALPVVVAPRTPMEFREWWPGAPTEKGVYDIPYPVGTEVLRPQAALVPVNGFDAGAYRLGYGGGFFDRTLASLPIRPVCIGLGYEMARLPTIHPQPHDVSFDFIVTEAGIHVAGVGGLRTIDADEADAALAAVAGTGPALTHESNCDAGSEPVPCRVFPQHHGNGRRPPCAAISAAL